MTPIAGQPILTVVQMRAAEQALFEAGTNVEALMRIAGRGAGEWVWRLAGGSPVTVLCGPGNNGGDGYVLAELIRERGGEVAVVAAREPVTEAARNARAGFGGEVLPADARREGGVFVDCLFGSGLTRPLSEDLMHVLRRLSGSHHHRIAVDLPSGVDSDRGVALNDDLPSCDLTLALGAWKFAHWTMPASATMGERRLIEIGIGHVEGAAHLLARPMLRVPAADSHKYTRGLLAIVGGSMPGAALLAAQAAMHGGAGYVKLLADAVAVPPHLVVDARPLAESLADQRIAALLVGPGLGRDGAARDRLAAVLETCKPAVLDADALTLLTTADAPLRDAVLTPHEGEMTALERAFGLSGDGLRRDRALALARASGAVVLLKGPDSLIASPDGALVLARPVTSWLSVAGSGDVLAGMVASRLATGASPVLAAEQALWLHGEAARLAGPAFTPSKLAALVQPAFAAALG